MSFDPTGDELAGVVDLFGGLTRADLERALSELAFRDGVEADPDALDAAVDEALADYRLLAVDHGDEAVLVAGPAAFPTLPAGAEDLPHILDVPDRDVPREALAARVRERLEADAERAAEEWDPERARQLLDVTYDAEAWAPVELGDVRATLQRTS
ncbi:MAG: hypothetical protein ABEJ70_00755 [Halobacteriaceae archaeon]